MMTLQKAVATLDGVIPSPDSKMVDLDHLPIATAWQECRKALVAYDDMQDKHDTLMRRWEGMVETIREKIDAGTLTQEDRQLLDALNLPHRYDKRTDTAQNGWQEIAPLTLEELKGIRREPVFIKYLRGNLPGEWKVIQRITDRAVDFTDKTSLYLPDSSPAVPCYGRTWVAYRNKPGDTHQMENPAGMVQDTIKDGCESGIYNCDSCVKNGNCPYQGQDGHPFWQECDKSCDGCLYARICEDAEADKDDAGEEWPL